MTKEERIKLLARNYGMTPEEYEQRSEQQYQFVQANRRQAKKDSARSRFRLEVEKWEIRRRAEVAVGKRKPYWKEVRLSISSWRPDTKEPMVLYDLVDGKLTEVGKMEVVNGKSVIRK